MKSVAPTCVSRVLIVEDNRDTADTMAILLKMHGFDVAVAYDGRSALQTAKRYDPDVVLLDLSLPDIDGHAVAEGLRRDGVERASLVAVSGHSVDFDWEGSRFDEHLVKPVGTDTLVSMLSRMRAGRP